MADMNTENAPLDAANTGQGDVRNQPRDAHTTSHESVLQALQAAGVDTPSIVTHRYELPPEPRADRDEILHALTALVEPGQTFEIRVPKVHDGAPVMGYFRSAEKAADAAAAVSPRAQAVYISLNVPDPARYDEYPHRQNRLVTSKGGEGLTDGDITRRRWLLVDLDATRQEANSSTTDAEHDGAIKMLDEVIIPTLRMRGWPEPLRGDSGNGAHALWRIDLPANDESDALVKGVLETMARVFAGEYNGRNPKITITDKRTGEQQVKSLYHVDTSVHNAARITKLYGTCANKGPHTADRPHRTARLLSVPEEVVVLTAEQMQAFIDEHIPAAPVRPTPPRREFRPSDDYDPVAWLDAFLDRHSVHFGDEWRMHDWEPYRTASGTGRKATFDICPIKGAAHDSLSACLLQDPDGKISFTCLSEGCKGEIGDNGWAKIRELVGEPQGVHRERAMGDPPEDDSGFPPDPDGEPDIMPDVELPTDSPTKAASHELKRVSLWPPAVARRDIQGESLTDLLAADIVPPHFAVPGLLAEGFNLLAAKPKVGKSWLVNGLAISKAAGKLALGNLPVQRGHVLLLALEGGRSGARKRMQLILGDSPAPAGIQIFYEWEPFDRGGYARLDQMLRDDPAIDLVIIDTLQKIRPASRRSGYSYEDDYLIASVLSNLGHTYHAAIVGVYHTRKQDADDPQDMVSGTTGLTGGADATLVMRRARGEVLATLDITGRDIEELHLALKWFPQTYHWSVSDEAADVLLLPERQQKILRAFEERGYPVLAAADVYLALNVKNDRMRDAAKHVIFRMVRDGVLVQERTGAYQVSKRYRNITHQHTSPASPTSPASLASPTSPEPPVTPGTRTVAPRHREKKAETFMDSGFVPSGRSTSDAGDVGDVDEWDACVACGGRATRGNLCENCANTPASVQDVEDSEDEELEDVMNWEEIWD